ncbi:Uncharacterised protein [Enterobacter cloacae]|uniref:Uncharacterized protein n=1 Tax=Enterobacter cloacae TaxID=550 RepID=A0A377M1V7_ENTCL|nr:Uncharacterised protein [Enterobacter cloacae]
MTANVMPDNISTPFGFRGANNVDALTEPFLSEAIVSLSLISRECSEYEFFYEISVVVVIPVSHKIKTGAIKLPFLFNPESGLHIRDNRVTKL